MSERLYVGTRKGLFALRRGASGWAIDGTAFLGDPVSALLPDPRSGRLHAGLALGHFGVKLYAGGLEGTGWEERPAPAFPVEEPEPDTRPSVSLIWSLENAGPAQPESLWAGTIPGGLFRSADAGRTWSLVDALWDRPERASWFGGGYDDPGIHSICVHPRDAGDIIVGVSCGGVWQSADGGTEWHSAATGMYAEYMPPQRRDDPSIQDPHRVVRCPADPDVLWAQHHNGVFRSTDCAGSWTEVTAVAPSRFGFAVAVDPRNPDRAWFVPAVKDDHRVPVGGALAVARTGDGGRRFEVLRDGLPQSHAYDLIYRHGLDVDESGERLAMGSTTGHLWISENGGARWSLVAAHLPPIACVRFA